MKAIIEQSELAAGLSIVGRAVASKSTLSVLGNVYLSANGDLELRATDLGTAITHRLPATVEADGATTVPARLFADLVKASPPGAITLSLREDGTSLDYRAGSVESSLRVISADEYPQASRHEEAYRLALSHGELKRALALTTFAAAVGEARPILAGVLFDMREGALTLAAADGFRLSVVTLETTTPVAHERVNIPAVGLAHVARLLSDSDDLVEIGIAGPAVTFYLGATDITVQRIEGNFPDYRQLIPKTTGTVVTLETGALLSAVRRAGIFARDAANIVRLTVGAGVLTIHAEAADVGDSTEELAAEVEGEPVEVAFNAKYLADALVAVGVLSERAVIELVSASSPGVLRATDDESFVHVIMPMHLGSR
jgi:DNA polymerase-3 subunit beta